MKPIIGIAGNQLIEGIEAFHNTLMSYTPIDIIHGLEKAGALPIVLPICDADNAKQYIDTIDGLVLAGGQDVCPFLYGEEPIPALGATLPIRDTFEMALIKEALLQKKPIFAICRGLQILNVACGGTLYQDIHTQADVTIKHLQQTIPLFVSHSITTTPGSILHRLVGDKTLVNTLHHQAIKDLAPVFRVSAISPDGFVEAIESVDTSQYILAVQWHPEILLGQQHEQSQLLFNDFVAHTIR